MITQIENRSATPHRMVRDKKKEKKKEKTPFLLTLFLFHSNPPSSTRGITWIHSPLDRTLCRKKRKERGKRKGKKRNNVFYLRVGNPRPTNGFSFGHGYSSQKGRHERGKRKKGGGKKKKIWPCLRWGPRKGGREKNGKQEISSIS